MPVALSNLVRTAGAQNTPGLKIFHRFALYADATTIPAPIGSPANFAEVVEVSADFVFATGKQWFKMEGILNKNMVDSNFSEQLDAAGVDNLFTIVVENTPTNRGFIQQYKSANLLMLIEDQQGNLILLGQTGLPARILSTSIKSGAAQPDEKNITLTVGSVGAIAPFYTGALQDTPAV